MKKIALIVLISVSLWGFEEAAFLKIEPSVRIAGSGEIGCATAAGISEVFLNPAGLSKTRVSFSANYTKWLPGIDYGMAGFAFGKNQKIPSSTFGFSVICVQVEDMEKRNEDGEILGMFGSSSYAFTGTYSMKLFEGILGGFNIKYLYENIDGNTAYGFACDIGLIYSFGFYRCGLSIKNVGTGLQSGRQETLTKTHFSLPSEIRIGGSYEYSQEIWNMTPFLDASLSLTGNTPYIGFGVEFDIMKYLYLRGGIKKSFGDKILQNGNYQNVSENTLSYGIGFSLKYGAWALDYAFYLRNDFIHPHRIGIRIEF